jgi:hypothetical protein
LQAIRRTMLSGINNLVFIAPLNYKIKSKFSQITDLEFSLKRFKI